MSIEVYRHRRIRAKLQDRITQRQELAQYQTPETFYPQPIQPSGVQQYQPRQSEVYSGHYNPAEGYVLATRGQVNNAVENRLGLLSVLMLSGGAAVALVLLSVGWMFSTIVRSGAEPAPTFWFRSEQVRSQ